MSRGFSAWDHATGRRDTPIVRRFAACTPTKQVLLSKDHHPELEAVILHNDIRAYGKGFERYYERAKNTPGVRYIWSKTSIVEERPDTKNVVLRYRINGTQVKDEEFDLVVLAVGLKATQENMALAEKLSVETNVHGFCEGPEFSPIETSRPGIFSCGTFKAPMDIPDSVTMASGAASLAGQLLWDQRGSLTEEKSFPAERDVRGNPRGWGVFVCDCGTNIVKTVNVKKVVDYIRHTARGCPRGRGNLRLFGGFRLPHGANHQGKRLKPRGGRGVHTQNP